MTMGQQNERIFMTRAEWKTSVSNSWPPLTTCQKTLEQGLGKGIGLELNPESLARRHIVYSVPFCFGFSTALKNTVFSSFIKTFLLLYLTVGIFSQLFLFRNQNHCDVETHHNIPRIIHYIIIIILVKHLILKCTCRLLLFL